jgi:putative DNA primase/helicase
MINAALDCLHLGLSVIPCDPATKHPLLDSWKPYQSRLPTEKEVGDWWTRWPEAAPAVVTGELSALVVVDIDSDDALEIKEAEKSFGETSWRARTPSGGMHLGYAHPGGRVTNACRISGFDFDIDIRGDGGYALVPPSPGYSWENEDPFETRPPFRGIPKQIAPTLEPAQPVTQNDRIPRGERNQTLASLGGTMRKRGMSSDAISAALLADNQKRCLPPLPKKEVLRIARSVGEYEPVDPRPKLLTAEEFANDLAPEEIIKGLIYRASTHLLTGASKTGKSWLAYQLVLSVQAGKPFLGLDVTRAKVLLVSLEMSAGMLRKRMEGIHRDIGLPAPDIPDSFNLIAPTMEQVPSLNLAGESGLTYLKDAIAETGAELVVLDTLYKFLPGCDPNSNAEMGTVFARIGDLAQSTGAAIVMLDHVAKGEHFGPVSHSAVGAQIKGGGGEGDYWAQAH